MRHIAKMKPLGEGILISHMTLRPSFLVISCNHCSTISLFGSAIKTQPKVAFDHLGLSPHQPCYNNWLCCFFSLFWLMSSTLGMEFQWYTAIYAFVPLSSIKTHLTQYRQCHLAIIHIKNCFIQTTRMSCMTLRPYLLCLLVKIDCYSLGASLCTITIFS